MLERTVNGVQEPVFLYCLVVSLQNKAKKYEESRHNSVGDVDPEERERLDITSAL